METIPTNRYAHGRNFYTFNKSRQRPSHFSSLASHPISYPSSSSITIIANINSIVFRQDRRIYLPRDQFLRIPLWCSTMETVQIASGFPDLQVFNSEVGGSRFKIQEAFYRIIISKDLQHRCAVLAITSAPEIKANQHSESAAWCSSYTTLHLLYTNERQHQHCCLDGHRIAMRRFVEAASILDPQILPANAPHLSFTDISIIVFSRTAAYTEVFRNSQLLTRGPRCLYDPSSAELRGPRKVSFYPEPESPNVEMRSRLSICKVSPHEPEE